MFNKFTNLIGNIKKNRRTIFLIIASMVVAITTYTLILPAFTLEKETADELGGIDVETEETEERSDISNEAADSSAKENSLPDNKEESDPETQDSAKSEYNESKKMNDTDDVRSVNFDVDKEERSIEEQLVDKIKDAQIKKTVINAKGDTWEVTVDYGKDALIPAGSELRVEEIEKDDVRYAGYYQKTQQTLNSANKELHNESDSKIGEEYTRIFDIQIWNGEEKIEPKADVRVDIKLLHAPKEEDISPKVVHFAEDSPEVMKVSLPDEENEEGSISFMTDEFSVYSVTYSVDFLYNGYGFSITGGDIISLKDLAEQLHIVETIQNNKAETDSFDITEENEKAPLYHDADEFIENVVNVEFSDPELILVNKVEKDCSVWDFREMNGMPGFGAFGVTEDEYNRIMTRELFASDWALMSLKPFDTQEQLIITLNGGKKIVIDVKDDQDAIMIDDGEGGEKVQTIANPSGTTIDMFDYWIVDNYWDSAANKYITRNTEGRAAWPGHTGNDNFGYDFLFYDYNGNRKDGWHKYQDSNGNWQVDKGYLVGNGNNQGINQNHIFKFTPSTSGGVVDGIRSTGRTWVNGIGWVEYENAHDHYSNSINSWTGTTTPSQGLFNKTLVNGYPQLSNNASLGTNGESLDYLFTQQNGNGKEYKGSADQLLYVDPDGYYTYDSRDYSATYNDDNTFTLRKQTSDNSEIRGFWPFGNRRYWFGMHMTTPFSMPANGQVLNPKGVYQDMKFEFSGDDDCLLYVDGVLIGDAGGIHLRSDVVINFKTGEITISGKDSVWLDDLFRAAGKYDDYQWDGHTFASGTYHTFEMFYLERGGGESNLHIKYNLVSTTDFTAHKSYHSEDNARLMRDQFDFELIGFDNTDYASQGDEFVKAIMPSNGTKTHSGSAPAGIELPSGMTAHTSLITGVTEDGNVNFGNIQLQESQAGKEYKYIVREVVPVDAENADHITWLEASDEVKAEGGFIKDGITYDGKVYFFKGVVQLKKGSTSEYELKKYRYTDATYTTEDTETKFFSFVNGYVKPITIKVIKKSDTGKLLSGADFTLTRAMKNDSDQWVVRKYKHDGEIIPSTPRTGTTSGGRLTFDDLTEGHYILEETNAPAGYEKGSTYRWLLTLSKQDAENKIILVPTIQELDENGNLQGTAKSLTPDSQNVIEHEVINGKIPRGPITVQKKWLKVDGNTEFTDAELEALGVDGTTITGELWRRAGGYSSSDEKFADFTLQNGNWSKTWTATELYGADQDQDWTYYFKNVAETPVLEDFEFTADPVVTVAGTTTTYTYKNIYQNVSVKILKVIKDTETPLPGAEFTLTMVDEQKHIIKDDNDEPIVQVKTTAETTGVLTFERLTPGAWYMLEETGVPAGYIVKEGPYYIHISEDGTGSLDTTVEHTLITPESGNEYKIENEPGSELPSAGGPGTTMIYMLGTMLTMLGGVLLIARRRASMNK